MRRFGLAAVLVLPGCTKTEPEVEDAPPAAEPAEAAVEDPTREPAEAKARAVEVQIAAREPPEVTVLAAGAEPREDLRLRPTAGVAEGIEIITTTRMAMGGGAVRIPPTAVPPIAMKGRAIIERADDREIAFRHVIDGVDVRDDPQAPPQLALTLREHLGAFEDYHAELRVDARGGLLGGTVYMPAAPAAPVQTITQMTESFGQIQVPLPREPVGVGAKWRAEVTIDQAGLQLQQTVDYTLERREGTELHVDATYAQELVDATFTPPGMLGVEAKVTRFESEGTGSMHLDLAHLVPTRSEIEMKIDMGLQTGEQRQDLSMIVGVAFVRS